MSWFTTEFDSIVEMADMVVAGGFSIAAGKVAAIGVQRTGGVALHSGGGAFRLGKGLKEPFTFATPAPNGPFACQVGYSFSAC